MKTKNLLIASALLLSVAPATYAEITLGLDFIKDYGDRNLAINDNEFDRDFNSDSTGYRLRLGLGKVTESRAELYFSQYDVDDEGQFNDSRELDFGVNFVMPVYQQKHLIPFIKAGAGVGMADTNIQIRTQDGDITDKIWNAHFNLGAGLTYSINKRFSLTGNVEYVYRNWQNLESNNGDTFGVSDSLYRVGLGVDYSF